MSKTIAWVVHRLLPEALATPQFQAARALAVEELARTWNWPEARAAEFVGKIHVVEEGSWHPIPEMPGWEMRADHDFPDRKTEDVRARIVVRPITAM